MPGKVGGAARGARAAILRGAHCSDYSHTSYARPRAIFGIL